MSAARPLRPATHSKPLPALERLAASLALTSAVVAPAAALLLHDSVCLDEGGSTVQRVVNRLERAGVFNVLTEGAEATPGACAAPMPAVVPRPETLTPPGAMQRVDPEPSTPPAPLPEPVRPIRPGEAPAVAPTPPPPQPPRPVAPSPHPMSRGGARMPVSAMLDYAY